MAGPGAFRNNVVVAAAGDATFDPPLDGLYVTTAGDAAGQGETFTLYIGGVSSGILPQNLTIGFHNLGGITRIVSTGNALRYIGLRETSSMGSANVTNDVIPEGG